MALNGEFIRRDIQGGAVWMYGCMAVWLYVLEYGMWWGEREGQRERERERRRKREVCIYSV